MTVVNEVTNEMKALAEFLGVDVNEVKQGDYDCQLYHEGSEYLVLTDEEAQEQAEAEIKEGLWCLDTDFIFEHISACSKISRPAIEKIKSAFSEVQDSYCESLNELIEVMVDDVNKLIEDVIESDGRGRFIAKYDGIENEHNGFYIYCVD